MTPCPQRGMCRGFSSVADTAPLPSPLCQGPPGAISTAINSPELLVGHPLRLHGLEALSDRAAQLGVLVVAPEVLQHLVLQAPDGRAGDRRRRGAPCCVAEGSGGEGAGSGRWLRNGRDGG